MYGHPKAKPIKNMKVELCLPSEEKPSIGKNYKIDVKILPEENYYFRFIFFELLNERTDKRSTIDRVTSTSRYFYRFNVDKLLEKGKEVTESFHIRIPMHKEPSRNDKFIFIKWSLFTKVVVSEKEDSGKDELLCVDIPHQELEVVL